MSVAIAERWLVSFICEEGWKSALECRLRNNRNAPATREDGIRSNQHWISEHRPAIVNWNTIVLPTSSFWIMESLIESKGAAAWQLAAADLREHCHMSSNIVWVWLPHTLYLKFASSLVAAADIISWPRVALPMQFLKNPFKNNKNRPPISVLPSPHVYISSYSRLRLTSTSRIFL